MSSLPAINISLNNTIYGLPLSGTLSYQYSPFKNLLNVNPQNLQESLEGLSIPINDAELSIERPINISTEVSYDNSINLIISDNQNPPKIVNSRFYLTSSTQYEIADRNGNLDTNIYTSSKFKEQASLIKNVNKITKLSFEGLSNGGRMKIGSYTFYFKFADADGNETNFVSESGKVVCHIGSINNPSSIRGGQMEENSEKSINFILSNVDLAYSYVKVYYTKTTNSGTQEITTAHKITDKFRLSEPCKLSISGYENHEDIDISEINTQYAYFNSIETHEVCQNLSFVGNVTNDYSIFSDLQKYSLYVTPSIVLDKDIGNLSADYIDISSEEGNEYYNTKNIYYKLGY